MSALEMSHVSKSFPGPEGALQILHDISLTLEPGEFVAIVGFSGTGKTTLINLLAGLLFPDSGSITVNDQPVTGPGPDRGVVFQNYSLLPWMTVRDNVGLAVDARFPGEPAAVRRARIEEYVRLVNLTPALGKYPRELSGGMRQRVSLARALAMEPQVLLLDEPFGALDALTRATLQDELARIRQQSGKTIVMITNDVDEALFLADRVIPLTVGPPATLGPVFACDSNPERDREAWASNREVKQVRQDLVEYLSDLKREAPHRDQHPIRKRPQLTPVAV